MSRLTIVTVLLCYFVGKFARSARIPAPLSASPESETEINQVIDYLQNFTSFTMVRAGTAGSSSSGGVGSSRRQTISEVATSPSFVENVMMLQRDVGEPETGVPDTNLIKKMKGARCGMADPPPPGSGLAEFVEMSKWGKMYQNSWGTFDLSYSFFSQTFPAGQTSDMTEGILAAMCLWEKNSNIRFARNLGEEVKNADVTISFNTGNHHDGFPFDGRGGTLAHAFYPDSGKLHFDKSEKWFLSRNNKNNYGAKDIFTVAAHELGHSLGLKHSSVSKALMAPFYKFVASYENYKLPQDEKDGMKNLYGNLRGSFSRVQASACYALKKYTGSNPAAPIPTKYPQATTTTTASTRRPRIPTETCPGKNSTYCQSWKRAGYCTDDRQIQTMIRLCKQTCGYCPVRGERKPQVAVSPPRRVCDIRTFDTVFVKYDYRGRFKADFVKDDYFFPMESDLPSYSFLESNVVVDYQLRWIFDPKTVPASYYKYTITNALSRTKNVAAILQKRTSLWIIQKSGRVDEYRQSGPQVQFVDQHKLQRLFVDYPHNTVDAAYVKYDRNLRKDVYTLFYKQSFWKFEETRLDTYGRGYMQRSFTMIETEKPIKEWQGVEACNVDAVFDYEDVPYFLRGNIFWPANSSYVPVARDITYNFFRCWKSAPTNLKIPYQCSRATKLADPSQWLFVFTLIFLNRCFTN